MKRQRHHLRRGAYRERGYWIGLLFWLAVAVIYVVVGIDWLLGLWSMN